MGADRWWCSSASPLNKFFPFCIFIFSLLLRARYFLCTDKESTQRFVHGCTYTAKAREGRERCNCLGVAPHLPVLPRRKHIPCANHAQQNRARHPWLALIIVFRKTPKLTHQHMGEVLLVIRTGIPTYQTAFMLAQWNSPIALAVRGVWLNASETRRGEAGRRAFVMSHGWRITKFHWVSQ